MQPDKHGSWGGLQISQAGYVYHQPSLFYSMSSMSVNGYTFVEESRIGSSKCGLGAAARTMGATGPPTFNTNDALTHSLHMYAFCGGSMYPAAAARSSVPKTTIVCIQLRSSCRFAYREKQAAARLCVFACLHCTCLPKRTVDSAG